MPVENVAGPRARIASRSGRSSWFLPGLLVLCLLLAACSSGSNGPTASTSPTAGGGKSVVPTVVPTPRVPQLSTSEQVAPSVKVLASLAPTVIIQFPLFPASIKSKFPNATALVTIIQGNPAISVFDTVTVDVQNMPPGEKFTIFFTEISAKPFGHAEYVGDVQTRGDGSGESVVHLITLVAFAADARTPSTSADLSGDASGIQLEHVGLWFDGVKAARRVLGDPTIPGTPFDGGGPPLHGGPQAMTDGQTLPVI